MPQPWLLLSTAALSLMTSVAHAKPEVSANCVFDVQLDEWRCMEPEGDQQLNAKLSDQAIRSRIELDWLPKHHLSYREQRNLDPGCKGAYVDPLAGLSLNDAEINTLPLTVEAESAEVVNADTATLQGDVRVAQGPRSISAEHMSYSRKEDKAALSGDVTIRQPGMLIRGKSAAVSTIDHKSEFKNALFVMHDMHMRGSAGAIEQQGPNKIVLKEGAISSCEPNSNAWSLQGEELGVNSAKGQGYGKNVKLKIGGVPVFYLPYISFPVGDERRSGFLFPSISNSDDGGLDISVPYYIDIADNMDMTVTPRLITGRGAMLELETRHLSRLFRTEMSGAYLGNDSGGNLDLSTLENDSSASQINRHEGSNRWLVQMRQTGGRRSGWYSNIDYTKTSDVDYFRDLGTSSFSVANTTYLNQSIDGGMSLENWHLYARVQDYQTLLFNLDAPYRKVPELAADGIYNYGLAKLSLKNRLTRFDHRDTERLNGSPIITGTRFFGDYRLGNRFSNLGAYFHPEIGYKVLSYNLDDNDNTTLFEEHINLGAAQFSLDIGAVFEHIGGNFLQTLEPRAKYLFREHEDHSQLYMASADGQAINFDTSTRNFSYGQLYRDTRFSGSDRLDDAHQVTVGLSNRWFTHDGHELFYASVGQVNHFNDRRIGLDSEVSDEERSSEWALEFARNWRDGSSFYGNMIYNDAARELSRLSAGYNYASEDQLSLYSIGYSFVRASSELNNSEALDQIDGAFVAPVSPEWYVMGRANYDIENKQELESFLGFEYNNCCYRLRFMFRRWLDSNIANLGVREDAIFDQGVFFEIHLKGLGGSGAKVNAILEDAIPGYRRREQILNRH